jgi:heptosyltransferase II
MGDAVMATPLLEHLLEIYPKAKITLVGSHVSCALFERDKRIHQCIVDNSKDHIFRLRSLYKLSRKVGKHDLALTLQNSLLSALFLYWTRTPSRIGYQKELRAPFLTHAIPPLNKGHQVKRYVYLLESYLQTTFSDRPLTLIASPISHHMPTLGINPSAAYGDAKRWIPERFAQVAQHLAPDYAIILFGGAEDMDLTHEIETYLKKRNIPVCNLAGKTSILELIDHIAHLSLFITNDSGPMHIATALKVPTIAIFGPTDHTETSPWNHTQSVIVRNTLSCAPCKKRTCPLGHHACMEDLGVTKVLADAEQAGILHTSLKVPEKHET